MLPTIPWYSIDDTNYTFPDLCANCQISWIGHNFLYNFPVITKLQETLLVPSVTQL